MHEFLTFTDLFSKYFFLKTISEIPSVYQKLWIQIRASHFVGPDLDSNCLKG